MKNSKLSASRPGGISAASHVNQAVPTPNLGPIQQSLMTIDQLIENLHGCIGRAEAVFAPVLRDPPPSPEVPDEICESQVHGRLANIERALRVAQLRLDALADRSTL